MKWFVIHPDGRRFGPVDERELRVWLEEKRAKRELEVENSITGERSTVEAVLELPPVPVEIDLSLELASDDVVPAPAAPTFEPLEWPATDEPGVPTATTDSGWEWAAPEPVQPPELTPSQTIPVAEPPPTPAMDPPPVTFDFAQSPPSQSELGEPEAFIAMPPTVNPGAEEKRLRGLVVLSYFLNVFGIFMFCCAPLPIIGFFVAAGADKKGAKGAKVAKVVSIIVTIGTIMFWVISGLNDKG